MSNGLSVAFSAISLDGTFLTKKTALMSRRLGGEGEEGASGIGVVDGGGGGGGGACDIGVVERG